MLDDAIKAITQIFAPPLRAVLWKSVGLALALIVVVGIMLNRLILWFLGAGSTSIETTLGPHAHWPASALAWLLSVAAGLGIIVGSVFLMPAVTAFVASFFADQIADEVEREHYPAEPPGTALPLWRAIIQGGRTALLAVLVYVIATPFLLFAGFGAVIFFFATAWLLSREYFFSRRHALSPARGSEGIAQAQRRENFYRWPVHRRLRLDPGRQSGDAAICDGFHGPHA
jgi:CysZ protein